MLFCLNLCYLLLKKLGCNEEFTYTYIRDRFVRPAEMFVERLLLNDEMMQYLIQQIT